MEKCPHCGLVHETTCARIKAIEYQPDGVTVKRIEFHGPAMGEAGPAKEALRQLAGHRPMGR